MNKEPIKIKIEHGIPFEVKHRSSKLTQAMSSMKVGDSFLYPENKRTHPAGPAYRLGFKMATRKAGNGMVRVWRVK